LKGLNVAQFVEFVGNHYILSTAWVALFLAVMFDQIKKATSPIKTLSPAQVTQKINRDDGVVVDIRNQAEFDKGHIAGAKHIAMALIQKNDLASLEKNKSKPIIVVCNAGMSASGAASKLFKYGFADVCILQGGMNTWQSANLPVTRK
jgi:rhodanese-related sulfurtransferase